MAEHVEDLAELYVIGDLDAAEVKRVESHIAGCRMCMRRVGEAEETLLALERESRVEPMPENRPLRLREPNRWSYPAFALAAAAGIVLGIFTMLPAALRPHDSQRALLAMVNSHFNHAQFAALKPGAPAAKVMYARDRRWLYVVLDGTRRYTVYAGSGPDAQRLGELHPDGATSTLFVDRTITQDEIELRDRANVIEDARVR